MPSIFGELRLNEGFENCPLGPAQADTEPVAARSHREPGGVWVTTATKVIPARSNTTATPWDTNRDLLRTVDSLLRAAPLATPMVGESGLDGVALEWRRGSAPLSG